MTGKYEQSINRLLSDGHAGFTITRTEHGYPGVATSSYQILIYATLASRALPRDWRRIHRAE